MNDGGNLVAVAGTKFLTPFSERLVRSQVYANAVFTLTIFLETDHGVRIFKRLSNGATDASLRTCNQYNGFRRHYLFLC